MRFRHQRLKTYTRYQRYGYNSTKEICDAIDDPGGQGCCTFIYACIRRSSERPVVLDWIALEDSEDYRFGQQLANVTGDVRILGLLTDERYQYGDRIGYVHMDSPAKPVLATIFNESIVERE